MSSSRSPAASRRAHRSRVLLLADFLGGGGAERQLTLLATHLPDAWHGEVWSLNKGPFADSLDAAGVKVTIAQRDWRHDPRPALSLWRTLKRYSPDVVHSWGWMSTAIAGPLCRWRGIPLIDGCIRRGMVSPHRGNAQKAAMRWASLIIANSRAGLQAYGVPEGKGRVIYNGFDMARLSLVERIPPALRWADASCLRVVMSGRLVPEKDYPAFLTAARDMSDASPISPVQFIVVGSGGDRRALEQSAGDLLDRGVVRFVEPGLEVLPTVSSAHVGVLLSTSQLHAEGCSNSILEYMACGLPVICTDTGGNPEVVEEGVTGFLVPPGGAEAVVDRLRWLLAHPATAAAMGEAGYARLVGNFSSERMVEQMVQAYQAVTGDR